MKEKKRRYSGTAEFYRKKLNKHMAELGIKPEHWKLNYDPWEGSRLDFTYKGVTRRLERLLDGATIHYGSDCLAQVTLTMEKFLWMKREGIFDLDVAAAGLPQLRAPLPEWCRKMGFDHEPESLTEVEVYFKKFIKTRHPDVVPPEQRPEANRRFREVKQAYDEAAIYFNGGTGR